MCNLSIGIRAAAMKEGQRIGWLKGQRDGWRKGQRDGERNIVKLVSYLNASGRSEDIKRLTDEQLRKQLISEMK
ncbi:MAG: hypothetical protein IJ468_13735 [Lachnospiraceae bacterium]|nr:hypothetical protein [Lachnospiraceae bacterium]